MLPPAARRSEAAQTRRVRIVTKTNRQGQQTNGKGVFLCESMRLGELKIRQTRRGTGCKIAAYSQWGRLSTVAVFSTDEPRKNIWNMLDVFGKPDSIS
jgi:hypothetical protein